MTPDDRGPKPGRLVEVAVALPVPGTFTYRDPRREESPPLPAGSQVVVPFGPRMVTGFVLGPAEANSTIPARDIEAVVAGDPALDEEMLALGRWAADYYQAPLGEVLRAGLPQGERAVSIRSVRLTPLGERAAREVAREPDGDRDGDGNGNGDAGAAAQLDPEHGSISAAVPALSEQVSWLRPNRSLPSAGATPISPSSSARIPAVAVSWGPAAILRALLAARGPLPLRVLHARFPGASQAVRKMELAGWLDIGDDVRDRRREPQSTFVVPAIAPADAPELSPSAKRRRALLARVASEPAGIDLAKLTGAERAHIRALARVGLVALEMRPWVAPALDAPAPTAPSTEETASLARARTLATAKLAPTAAQAEAIAQIQATLGQGYSTFLLRGVTGSGKTEVYLRVIAAARAAGRGALVLVPEIALTPQLAARFRARFGDDVAVLHSGLPARERLAAWRRLRAGKVGIALGARSAVFAPVRALGIVVVDEEHDPSFKQEEGVRYNGRDLAVVRAQRAGAVAVLGSATPSLESHRNAELGRYRPLLLPTRATPRPLPPVEIIDLRRFPVGADGLLSSGLAEAIAANLSAGQQTILFLNRRGFSTFILCRACGLAVRCKHCSVSLTYHRARDRLLCHYCGTQESVPSACPACRETKLERLGAGTERAEAIIRARFPGARVARLDRDTAGAAAAPFPGVDGDPESELGDRRGRRAGEPAVGARTGLDEILRGMGSGEIDILIGTQMVTKGHDFGGVTLVGVLHPDQSMHLPDFRATERVFQLLEQVAGRAGRGDRPGRVIIQTYLPEHPAIVAVIRHDYEGFARAELREREAYGYPPFARMAVLRLDAADEAAVRADAAAVAAHAARAGGAGVVVRGPAPAPIARIRGRSRFQVWLSSIERATLLAAVRGGMSAKLQRDVRMVVDVDPQSSL